MACWETHIIIEKFAIMLECPPNDIIRSFQQLIQQIRITFFPLDLIFKRHQNHTAPEGIVSLTQTGKMIPCEQKFNEALFWPAECSEFLLCRYYIAAAARQLFEKSNIFDYDAVHISRQFFLGDVSPHLLEAILMRYISLIRPGRMDTRKTIQKSSVSFTYRAA